jgi:hypothetical protein
MLFVVHVLVILFSMLNVSYFYVSIFRSTRAVFDMAVVRLSLLLCFPGMFLGYLPNNNRMVLPAPLTFVLTFHTRIPSEIAILFVDALPFHYHGL